MYPQLSVVSAWFRTVEIFGNAVIDEVPAAAAYSPQSSLFAPRALRNVARKGQP